ncbi:MAG: hypothetical protein WCI54_12425 [Bacteroidia bacterium]|jgi:hypothetical protein
MLIKNRLYSSFGPFESFAAKLVFIFGCAALWFSLKAILLIFGGAFFGFTYFCTTIDIEKHRVRSGDVLFGIFSSGQWLKIEPDMTVGVIKWEKVWRILSLSNRIASVPENDFLVVLFNSDGKKLLTLNKKMSLELANDELFHLSDLLNLRRISR